MPLSAIGRPLGGPQGRSDSVCGREREFFWEIARDGLARVWGSPVNFHPSFLFAIGVEMKPKWRNGRRAGLKIQCPQGRVGSTPTFGTPIQKKIPLQESTVRID